MLGWAAYIFTLEQAIKAYEKLTLKEMKDLLGKELDNLMDSDEKKSRILIKGDKEFIQHGLNWLGAPKLLNIIVHVMHPQQN